jgi:phosphate transport system protein
MPYRIGATHVKEPDVEKLHASRDFETELRELRAHMLAMGARCERSVSLALEACWAGDAAAVADVKALDAHIDRDEIDIDALVLRILALREPLASDLRFVATALKLVTDLERVGDEAVNIARRAEGWGGPAGALAHDPLLSMADRAQEMLRSALRCFVDKDVAGAKQIMAQDDEVDRLFSGLIETMTRYMTEHAQDVPMGIRVVQVAKSLERIADHATNISEEVIFMFRGDDVRHARSDD